jgi:phosphohistidine phosphatase
MRLYLIRHAEAAPGEPDAQRPLTPAGKRAAQALGRRLRDEGTELDAILTSPLLRARQTGEELALAHDATPAVDDRLAPGASADGVRAAITGQGEHVAVVGHQPDCGHVAAELTGSPEPPFPPAGIVVVDLES